MISITTVTWRKIIFFHVRIFQTLWCDSWKKNLEKSLKKIQYFQFIHFIQKEISINKTWVEHHYIAFYAQSCVSESMISFFCSCSLENKIFTRFFCVYVRKRINLFKFSQILCKKLFLSLRNACLYAFYFLFVSLIIKLIFVQLE